MTQDLRVVLEFFGSCHRHPSFGRFLLMEGKKNTFGGSGVQICTALQNKTNQTKKEYLTVNNQLEFEFMYL